MQREGRERLPVLVVDGHPIVADAIGGVLVDLDSRLDITVCHSAVGAIDAFRRVPTWFRILVDLQNRQIQLWEGKFPPPARMAI
ncbi:hypothetical protein [Burkholderia cepacia]|uniref:hypothetical protein n=1 Tax=Burkholderia cepacia TaxID=292 RepID=UPI002AB7EA0E|nr:hypothetical protein [Burkholderia cepacia]